MEPPHHSAGSYDPAYYGTPSPYPPQLYPHSQAFYPSISAAPSHLHPHPNLPNHGSNLPHHGSSSDSSPYFDTATHAPASYPTSSYTDHTSPSSFESHSSPHIHGVPPYGGYHPPPPPPHAYHYPPPPHAYHPGYPWPPPARIQYVTNIRPQDVLSGRGGATNSHCKYFQVARARPSIEWPSPTQSLLCLLQLGTELFEPRLSSSRSATSKPRKETNQVLRLR
jgi:hypothetical protein